MAFVYFIIIGFLSAIAAPFIHKKFPNKSGLILCIFPIVLFAYLVKFIPTLAAQQTYILKTDWFESVNVSLSFLIDGLSLTFALIVIGVGAIILYYSGGYMHGHRKQGRFYSYLIFFMVSMFGVVVSNDIITLFIFWELTSISSFLLIGFNHEQERSRYAALQSLLVTGGGGLALFAGLIIMGSIAQTYSISEILTTPELFTQSHLYIPVVILIFAGAFTKSAQFPFHFWLPNAMEAPTPVSAYLHSATMVKAGVFLLARVNPALGGTEIWQTSLLIFGGATMLVGAAMAIGQNDLKRILAYTTVSALGIMVFLIGTSGKYAITAAITFLVVHALYKGALFLVAGAIDHETGTRDISKLGGLKNYLPIIATAAILAGLSYCGIPPFLGFIGKELIYEAAINSHLKPYLLTAVALLTNMLLVTTAMLVVFVPFFGKYKETPKHPHEAPLSMWLGPMILGILGLLFGLFPSVISKYIVSPAVFSIHTDISVPLSLWHGFSLVLLLSLLTLLGGIFFFYVSSFVKKKIHIFNAIAQYGPEAFYNVLLKGLLIFSSKQTKFFQSGYLRHYIYFILATCTGLLFFISLKYDIFSDINLAFTDVYFYEVLLVVIMILAILKAIVSKSVLASVAALGIVGFGVAIIFVLFSAPDLAFTQFSVETLTILLIVLVVYKIPRFAKMSSRKAKSSDATIAISSGILITVLIIIFSRVKPYEKISDYFLENSYVLAHGRNVVNVILVDFRMLDTMGEITVLAVAAIGVLTLLRFSVKKRKTSLNNNQENENDELL